MQRVRQGVDILKIKIKPLSVNRAWQGKRFRTPEYKAYQQELSLKLKPMDIPEGELCIALSFGFSSKLSDIDNPIKNFVDCLCKKYGFDDRRIYRLVVVKEIVPKGTEYVEFIIESNA